jgi:hypothetical protein
MKEEEFRAWLSNMRHNVCGSDPLDAGTINSRIANCKRVARFEGDLDEHFDRNRLRWLIERLSYSRSEDRQGMRPRHRIPIEGDTVNGTATLKSAVGLYQEFRENEVRPRHAPQHRPNGLVAPSIRPVAGPLASQRVHAVIKTAPSLNPDRPRLLSRSAWPVWRQPEPTELLALAHLVIPLVRFLNPDVVRAVVEDNERHRLAWTRALEVRHVEPGAYLWEKSACAFPGVRRYAGSREIAAYRGHATLDKNEDFNALDLDDNDYPKQIWSFVFLGRQFSRFGPEGYALAHLADHKDHGNRCVQDFEVTQGERHGHLYGLYTCPSNTAYLPVTMIKPTDFAGPLRSLLIRRAQQLYGSFCAILPPHLRIPENHSADWNIRAFNWADPVGTTDHLPGFLGFREQRMERLFNQSSVAQIGCTGK